MNQETQAAAPGTWTLLRIGHKRRDVSTKAHRVGADDRTGCGFLVGDRGVPAPAGARRCLICEAC